MKMALDEKVKSRVTVKSAPTRKFLLTTGGKLKGSNGIALMPLDEA